MDTPSPSLHFGDCAFSLLLGRQVGKEQKSQRSEAMWASPKGLLRKPASEGKPTSESQREDRE